MKICYVANGASIHTQRWVNSLSAIGHEIVLISPRPTPIGMIKTARIIDFSRPDSNSRLGYLQLLTKIKKIVHHIKPDILHAHYASGYGFLGRWCDYHPFVISVWGSDIFDFPKKSPLHQWILSKNLASCDAIASTSHCMATETKRYLAHDKPMYITPFGVDTNRFNPKTDLNTTVNGDLVIGVIKTLEPIYGIENLITAFIALSVKYEKLKLLVVGNGSEAERFKRMIGQAGLSDRAQILPAVPHDQVPVHLQKIDIFVVPSRSESFGVAALEASASGLPVVASDVGGLPEVVIDQVTGCLVPPDNIDRLVDTLDQLIQSPVLRAKFGEQGHQFVRENYSWDSSVAKMEHLYKSIVQANP